MATLHIGDTAPNVTVRDDEGQPTELQSLWAERAVVLLFLRHLG